MENIWKMLNEESATAPSCRQIGGPWLFGLLLMGLLVLLALVLSATGMKFVGVESVDELPGPAPTQHGSQIDHSFPFLWSLNEVPLNNLAL